MCCARIALTGLDSLHKDISLQLPEVHKLMVMAAVSS
jgi:hypothetical protein